MILPGTIGARCTPFKSNYSLLFDGVVDHSKNVSLTTPNRYDEVIGTGDLTISMFAKFLDTGSARTLLYIGTGTFNKEFIWIYKNASDKLIAYFRAGDDGSGIITGTTTLGTSNFYHIAVTRTGTTAKLYIDGTQEGGDLTSVEVGAALGDATDGSELWVGSFRNGISVHYGHIDELAIHSDDLTASEVAAIASSPINLQANQGNYASASDLFNWFRAEEGTGLTTADSQTGSTYDLTFVADTTFSSTVPS